MDTSAKKTAMIEEIYRCPVCGHGLPFEPPVPRFDAPCSECGGHIWCRRRVRTGDPVLEVLPGRTPEPWDVEQVVDVLVKHGAAARVFLDLSKLDSVDSAFVARLLSMSKRIRSSAGRLLLCGMRPVVREMFDHLRLDKAFEISECPADAMALA